MALFDFLKRKKKDEFGDFGAMPGMEGLPGGMPAFGQDMQGIQTGMPGIPGMSGFGAPGPAMPNMGPPPQRQVFAQSEPMQPMQMQFGQQPMMQSQMQQGDIIQVLRNNTEVLSSKIDSLKAAVDRVSEKLDYIERYVMGRR